MSKKTQLYLAGFATLFGLGGIGALLLYFFQDTTIQSLIDAHILDFWVLILIGIIYGSIASGILVFTLRRKFLYATKKFFSGLMQKFQVSNFEIIFLSFCAGVGEEILFRGAIQTWLGVWITSFIFIALHGYLNPKEKSLFIYGIILFFVSSGFGYLMHFFGIWPAIIAHFIIDVFLMLELKNKTQARNVF